VFILNCDNFKKNKFIAGTTPVTNKAKMSEESNALNALLSIRINLDSEVYRKTNFGEPPQIAIWLEQPEKNVVRTIWVTRRLAKADWVGKVECLTALPYWISRYKIESGSSDPPTFREPLEDAITGATEKKEILATSKISANSKWDYYVEVNVSADYNINFPAVFENGWPDPDGNGQPSLIYKGQIDGCVGEVSLPILIGRTKQWGSVEGIISDLSKVTTAKNIIKTCQVSCQLIK